MAFGHDGVHPPVLKHGPRRLTSMRVIYLLKVYGALKGKLALCEFGVNRASSTIGAAPAEAWQSAGFLSLSIHVGTRKVVTYA